MNYNENEVFYLDEINNNEENFNREEKFRPVIHGLFPENLDTYCPGCASYLSSYNAYNINPYSAPVLPKYFLGTPFVNPINNNFHNYIPSTNFYSPVHPHSRPVFYGNELFTTPVVSRDSSDLFL